MSPRASLWGLSAAIALMTPSVAGWFQAAGLRWLYIFLLALSLSAGLMPLCDFAARRLNILD
ncbi:MAG: hypothetical protein AB1515_08475, partial [Nitrospirota bacterium]